MYLDIMSEIEAKEICSWEYEGEYSDYNLGGWDKCIYEKSDITKSDKREKEFFVAFDDSDKMIGFIRMSSIQNLSILGIGLRPQLCGRGLGGQVLTLAIEKSKEIFPEKRVVLMVKPFNKRGIKCYTKLGFKMLNKNFETGGEKYIIMQYGK